MIKKYEIINDGDKKRIKALRSFHVQGRYVNIGDVGGIVYDENTLSQEGNCWIFSGNLNYPSIRVSGDSIVDTNGYEGAVTDPRPFVNITGASALIGAHDLVTGKSSGTKTLTPSDMEVGIAAAVVGKTYEESKEADPTVLRVKATLYRGGTKTTIEVASPDYQIKVLSYDVNGLLFSVSPNWVTGGPDIAVTTEDCYYYAVLVRKTAGGDIAVADITTAAVTISETLTECTININDSRIDFAFVGAVAAVKFVPGGRAASTPDSKYPEAVIRNSKVLLNVSAGSGKTFRIMGNVIDSNVTVDASTAETQIAGLYIGVKNLMVSGVMSVGLGVPVYDAIRVNSCDNFALSPEVFPGYAAGIAANAPFIFIRCNVPNGIFYHNAKIKNTYTDIDFAKAIVDLGKTTANYVALVSSEVEGMYRLCAVPAGVYGSLVESRGSVIGATIQNIGTSYNTTIYKDAYIRGKFEFAGTNVFGGTGNHGGGKGCEITNTKETAMVISGNVRVEGNAKVKDTRINGTGYFGGNSVTENAYISGSAYVTDNGVFSPAPEEGKFDSDIHIEDNAKFLATSRAGNTVVYMCGDSEFSGTIAFNTISLAMYGKSRIAGRVSGRGVLILEDNADTSDKSVGAYGCIRLVGNYRQTKEKLWTGRRTISSENEPTYDNNVKTKYDF